MGYFMVLLREEGRERPMVLHEGEYASEVQALAEWAKEPLSARLVQSDEWDQFNTESKVKLAEYVLESYLDLVNYTVTVVWLMDNSLGQKYELTRREIFMEED